MKAGLQDFSLRCLFLKPEKILSYKKAFKINIHRNLSFEVCYVYNLVIASLLVNYQTDFHYVKALLIRNSFLK